MALDYDKVDVSTGLNTATRLNSELTKIQTALTDGLSRSGNGSNAMSADLDMGDNDIINAGAVQCDSILVGGQPITSVAALAAEADRAETAATAAEASAAAAADSVASANLPSVTGGDAGKILRVNSGEDGYELTAALLDNEVTTAKINDAAVTAAKLAANIQVPVLLSTTAITAVASIDLPTVFSANPSYRYFLISIEDGRVSTGVQELCLRVSIDGSTFRSTAGDYDWFYSQQDSLDAALVDANSSSATLIEMGGARPTTNNGDTQIRICNPHNTTDTKAFSFDHTNATGTVKVVREFGVGGFLATTDDITGVQLLWKSGGSFAAGGNVKVYGSNVPF